MANELKSFIAEIGLNNEATAKVLEKIQEIGVESIDDLQYLKESDLTNSNIMKPIHARKLLIKIEGLQQPAASQSSTHVVNNPHQSGSQIVPETKLPVTSTPSKSIHTRNLMSKLTEFPDKLLSSERLESDQRRRFVRAVVDEIRKTSKHFPKRQFEEIASQIVKMYPNNFEDRIDKIRVGSGYASLMQQLISRNENLNRKHPKEKKDTSVHVEKVNEQGKMRKRKSIYDTDTYGCVSWGPHISTEEEEIQETLRKELQDMYANDQFDNVIENMKKTYPLQRQNINEGKTLKLLLDEWPFLVQENVMMQHCEELLGIKLQEALGEMYLKKGVRMLKFFQSRKDANSVLKKYLDEVEEEKEMDNVVALLPATIQCLQAYLGEKENSLFLIMDEMSSPEEVERSNEKNWPRLAMLGPSAMSAKQSMLLVDGKVIGRYNSFVTAFALLFGAYYMFNIEYPSEAAVTLEFAQRCFFGINPESGCKTAKKKKTSDTHAKVLKLLKDLADYEWKDI